MRGDAFVATARERSPAKGPSASRPESAAAVGRDPITHLPMATRGETATPLNGARPTRPPASSSEAGTGPIAAPVTSLAPMAVREGPEDTAPQQRFAVGEIVRLVGLVLRPDENGKDGEVIR